MIRLLCLLAWNLAVFLSMVKATMPPLETVSVLVDDQFKMMVRSNDDDVVSSGPLFSIRLEDGTVLEACRQNLVTENDSSVRSPHNGERKWTFEFKSEAAFLEATFSLAANPNSPTFRSHLTLKNNSKDAVRLQSVRLFETGGANATVSNDYLGIPVVVESPGSDRVFFFSIESPLARNIRQGDHVLTELPIASDLDPKETISVTLGAGISTRQRLHRDFIDYIESIRPRKYSPHPLYNTWYDVGYSNEYGAPELMKVIEAFEENLHHQRGVAMGSYVMDDGWDNPDSIWDLNKSLQLHQQDLVRAAAKGGSSLGLWISPWGGYNQPKIQRLKVAEHLGYSVAGGSLTFADRAYARKFEGICTTALRDLHVNYFKFDGLGIQDPSRDIPEPIQRDFENMLGFIAKIRTKSPSVYISQTVGTWPSPYWLCHVDNIWRGGEDHSFAGSGTQRQAYITYRDGVTYERVVSKHTHMPLNSVMTHGVILAHRAEGLTTATEEDFRADVMTLAGSGTQAQEFYISHDLMTAGHWDVLAVMLKWSQERQDVLKYVEWLGGSPLKGEVYGWQAFGRVDIFTLRNPSAEIRTVSLQQLGALIPSHASGTRVRIRFSSKKGRDVSGEFAPEDSLRLEPFETVIAEAKEP